MLFVRRVLVGDQERALLIRDKRFERALEPGRHWVWLMPGAVEVEFHNVKALEFQSTWVDYLVKERAEVVSRLFTVVETGDAQVAVVYPMASWRASLDPVSGCCSGADPWR